MVGSAGRGAGWVRRIEKESRRFRVSAWARGRGRRVGACEVRGAWEARWRWAREMMACETEGVAM